MSSTVAPTYRTSFGFALPKEFYAFTSPTTWLPLEYEAVNYRKYRSSRHALSCHGARCRGEGRITGRVQVPLIPGYSAELFHWIQQRNEDGQGVPASVLIDCVHLVKKIIAAKVRTATFDFSRNQPVTCTLGLAALGFELGTTPSPTVPARPAYRFNELWFELGLQGSEMRTYTECQQLRLMLDNGIPDSTIAGGLPNVYPLQCYGLLRQNLTSDEMYHSFLTGQEATMRLRLTRGVNVVTFTLHRVFCTRVDVQCDARSPQVTQYVEFVALGSDDGHVPPIVIA